MKLMVVSPHPDDETLGAGGMLLKYKDFGNDIFWLNITNMQVKYGYAEDIVKKRNEQIKKINEKYRFNDFYDLSLRPSCLEKYDSSEIINKISDIFKGVQPDMVILPNRTDAHSDHKTTFDWCYACTKIFRYPFVKNILTMEILSETDFGLLDNYFIPNYFVDISNYFLIKEEILNIYESEVSQHPFPRSSEGIEALAKLRGIAAGVKYAEAFKVIKIIQ